MWTALSGAPPPTGSRDRLSSGSERDWGRFHHSYFDAPALAVARAGRSASVCLPARDEEATVGPIVSPSGAPHDGRRGGRPGGRGPVVDDGSVGAAAARGQAAGARVIPSGIGGGGKGQARRMALVEARGRPPRLPRRRCRELQRPLRPAPPAPLLLPPPHRRPTWPSARASTTAPATAPRRRGGGSRSWWPGRSSTSSSPIWRGSVSRWRERSPLPAQCSRTPDLDPDYGIEIGLLVDVADPVRHRDRGPGRPRGAYPPQPAPGRAAPRGHRRPSAALRRAGVVAPDPTGNVTET